MSMELELLGRALASEFGIAIRLLQSSDAALFKQKLYRVRKSDQAFQSLSIVSPPNDPLALWIVKQGVSDGQG